MQDAAVSVDDRLRQAGRARGVEDPEGVVEGNALEGELGARPRSSELSPGHRHGGLGAPRGSRARARRSGRGRRRSRSRLGICRGDVGDDVEPVEVLAAVAVAVDGRTSPSARSGRSGRRRCPGRSPASSSTRWRRGWPWRGRRSGPPGRSAGRRRRGRPCVTPRARRPSRTAATCSRSSPQRSSESSRSSDA